MEDKILPSKQNAAMENVHINSSRYGIVFPEDFGAVGKSLIRDALEYAMRYLECKHPERGSGGMDCPRCRAAMALSKDKPGDYTSVP